MALTLIDRVVPAQHKGNHSLSRSKKRYRLPAFAESQYRAATARMLQVNAWHHYVGPASAAFQLVDADGNEVHRQAREGDFFQIDVPGPGSAAGGGKDWVRVEKIGLLQSGGEELAYMQVRPSNHPLALNTETAHFFSHDATSTFLVYRHDSEVTAAVYGRNETPNSGTVRWTDRLRDWITAIGAMLGISHAQWKPLVSAWLDSEAHADGGK